MATPGSAAEMESVSLSELDTGMTDAEAAEFRRAVYESPTPAEESGAEPIVDAEEKDPEEVAAKEEGAEVDTPDDPPKGDEEMPAWAKTMFDKLSTENETKEKRVKQLESRVGGLTNTLSENKKAADKAAQEAADAPSPEAIAKSEASKKAIDELVDEFPEWGNVLKDQLGDLRELIESRAGGDVAALKLEIADLKEKVESGMDVEKAFMEFSHPGWFEKKNSKKFQDWMGTQPDEVKEMYFSESIPVALDMLDMFDDRDNSTQKTPAEIAAARRKRVSAAKNPKTEKSDAPKPEDAMTKQEFRNQVAAEYWPKKT